MLTIIKGFFPSNLDDIFANEVLNSLEKRPLGDYEDVQVDDSMFGIPLEQSENEGIKHTQETEEKQENADQIGKTEEKIPKAVKGQSAFI